MILYLAMFKIVGYLFKLSPRFDRRDMMHADAIRLAPVHLWCWGILVTKIWHSYGLLQA